MAIGFSLFVIGQKREPSVALSWILAFFFLPYIGAFLYLLVGYRRYRRRWVKKPDESALAPASAGSWKDIEAFKVNPDLKNLCRVTRALTGFVPSGGNKLELLEESEATDEALAKAIRNAKHHVNLEYYIFKPDHKGVFFRDLLVEAAKRGVECRVLLDAIGSFWLTPAFVSPLKSAGAKVSFFRPLRIHSPWGFHLRNHRKLAVIDGVTAFAGSQNISGDSTYWRSKLISWKETNVKLEGPAVQELQKVFVEDWRFATGEHLQDPAFWPKVEMAGDAYLQTIPTGPDKKENTLQLIFLTAIYAAQKHITITTPYFVPTPAVVLALQCAARSGVNVEVLVPRISDQPLTLYAGRSWYRELVESGIKVYEDRRRFTHAKVITIDDEVSLLGSANMDNRSFLINHELSLLLYDSGVTRRLKAGFRETVSHCKAVHLENLIHQSFGSSLLEGAARILSPLL